MVTAPNYLCAVAENHHIDKFNAELMYEQIILDRCIELIDEHRPPKSANAGVF